MEKSEVQKSLKEEAKAEGLNVAEETVKSVIKVAFRMLPKLITLIKNPTIQMVAGILVTAALQLESAALEWADGIDGVEG